MATSVPRGQWKDAASLPGRSGSGVDARIELTYAGKASVSAVLETPPAETIELWKGPLCPERMPNRLYYGDNLPLLAALMADDAVRGHVRLVYIDPPFASNGVFQSRCQTDAYHDLLCGARYLEFLRRRLILLRELLADDGSIYVHLDQKMAFQIKVIMDEVFDARCFRGCITRKKCNPKNYTKKTYGNVCDYILFYTKTDKYVWNRPYDAWTPDRANREYPCIERETGRRYKKVPVHAPGVRNGRTGMPWRGMNPPPGKHWQYAPETLDELDANGEIYWSPTGNPRRKVYFDASKGVVVQDLWSDVPDAHNQMVRVSGYPTEKNPQLLSRIIAASSHEGDLVLDAFAGSGTTLAVASELHRRWIGIDDSIEAIGHMFRRFASGRQRMGDYVLRERNGHHNGRKHPPSLFDSETESPVRGESDFQGQRITDFTFSAIASEAKKAASVLHAWQGKVHDAD